MCEGFGKNDEVGPEIQVVALLFSFCVCRDERTIVDPMKSRGERRKSKSSAASELASLLTTIGGRKIVERREGRLARTETRRHLTIDKRRITMKTNQKENRSQRKRGKKKNKTRGNVEKEEKKRFNGVKGLNVVDQVAME